MRARVKDASDNGLDYLRTIPPRRPLWPTWKREWECRVYDWEMNPSFIASHRDQTLWERYN
jgi:hypothetical protein